MHLYSAPLSQYFVEPPFAAIKLRNVLWYVSKSSTCSQNEIFANSLQNNSTSVRFDHFFMPLERSTGLVYDGARYRKERKSG